MADTLTSTVALVAAMPPVAQPTDTVEVRLLYDPFQPETVESHNIIFRDGMSLSEYLGDLPSEAEYMVFHNGVEVDISSANDIPIQRSDLIGVILLPLGGNAIKSVLRIVMIAAFVAVGAFLGGLPGAMIGSMIGGLVSTFLFKPKVPKAQDQDERSYGIDGAKNSATEGIPYPVTYGEFRVAGNFCDTYTENVGDNQFLYLRTVLNDGAIDSISDIEVNEQPIANFKQVQHRIKLGSLTEETNDWFRSSVRQINKGIKLDTSWTTHITTEEVDQIRFDVSFPSGLVSISQKKGTYRSKSLKFEMEFRKVEQNPSTGNWEPVAGPEGVYAPAPHDEPADDFMFDTPADYWQFSATGATRLRVQATAPTITAQQIQLTTSQGPAVEYRQVGSSTWTGPLGFTFETGNDGYVSDAVNDGTIAGPTNITPRINAEGFIDLPGAGDYEFRGVNGAEITRATSYPSSGVASVTVTDSRTRAIRRSFTTQRLDRGHYEVRIRRTTTQSLDQYEIDEVHLTDIAEIDADPVALRGTANLSLRIQLNEQLNNIPQLTCKVKGSLCQQYDRDGNPTVKEWTANPAWIGLDILCGAERGAGMPTSRIDFPRWFQLAEYCDANNITFNGVFAEGTNIGDALRTVLRVGHAAPVPFGTKVSVAIDRSRQPVTLFTQASMIEKTFQVNYLSLQDRANEFEVTYYDKTDRNKAKSIRYVDPKAVTFNEMPRSTSAALVGVDNITQATEELWRMIYSNRLIIRTVQFESFMEAINLGLGDVALIQHDQMDWANNGRLAAGSTTTTVKLDQDVQIDGDKDYSILVHLSAVKRMSARQVYSVVGNKVLVEGSNFNAQNMKATRLVCSNGEDLEITKMESGATYHTITLAAAPQAITSADTVELYETDAVEECPVAKSNPRTNWLRNSAGLDTATGLQPATNVAPTNWNVTDSANGVTRTLTHGVDSEGEYVDLRFVGTPTSTITVGINGETNSGIPVAQGEQITLSADVQLVAGSYTGTNMRLRQQELLSNLSNNGGGTSTTFTPTSQRQRHFYTRLASQVGTAFMRPAFEYRLAMGVAHDFTVRVRNQQVEKVTTTPTDYIRTTGTARTVFADVTTDTVDLATALSQVPDQYANFVFGEVTKVRKPYVLTGVSGSGIEKRRLTFVEYNEGIYGPPEVEIPIPVAQVSDRNVRQVQGLLFDYERLVGANRKTVNVRIFWNAAGIRNYAGADVYMRHNGGDWSAVGSAANVSEFNMQMAPEDNVEFKVVAYSTRGDRAPIVDAPSVSGDLVVERAELDPPTAFSAVQSGFQADGSVAYAFTPPEDATGVEGYEIEARATGDASWFALGRFTGTTHVQTGLSPGSYVARVRSISTDSASEWVETTFAIAMTPESLLANFSAGNDRNAAPIAAPTLPSVGSIEHTLNTDGSANVSLEWEWSGDDATIDGFRIKVTQA